MTTTGYAPHYAAADYWKKNKNKIEKLSPVSFGLYQGMAVPSYVDIDSIEKLNANADKLGNRIIGIEPGPIDQVLNGIQYGLLAIPPSIFIIIATLFGWQVGGRKIGISFASLLSLY